MLCNVLKSMVGSHELSLSPYPVYVVLTKFVYHKRAHGRWRVALCRAHGTWLHVCVCLRNVIRYPMCCWKETWLPLCLLAGRMIKNKNWEPNITHTIRTIHTPWPWQISLASPHLSSFCFLIVLSFPLFPWSHRQNFHVMSQNTLK